MKHHHPSGLSLAELHPIQDLKRKARDAVGALDHLHNADGVVQDGPLEVGSEIVLNAVFVEQVGVHKAHEFCAVLEELGKLTHHGRDEIRSELKTKTERIGLTLCPVEMERFVDEIARTEWVHASFEAPAG